VSSWRTSRDICVRWPKSSNVGGERFATCLRSEVVSLIATLARRDLLRKPSSTGQRSSRRPSRTEIRAPQRNLHRRPPTHPLRSGRRGRARVGPRLHVHEGGACAFGQRIGRAGARAPTRDARSAREYGRRLVRLAGLDREGASSVNGMAGRASARRPLAGRTDESMTSAASFHTGKGVLTETA
jgi:hypothetical protein